MWFFPMIVFPMFGRSVSCIKQTFDQNGPSTGTRTARKEWLPYIHQSQKTCHGIRRTESWLASRVNWSGLWAPWALQVHGGGTAMGSSLVWQRAGANKWGFGVLCAGVGAVGRLLGSAVHEWGGLWNISTSVTPTYAVPRTGLEC